MTFSKKEQWTIFICLHAGLLLALLILPPYLFITNLLPAQRCGMVELAGLYCPLCGATRAFYALLRFDILNSLRLNPFVIMFILAFVAYDIPLIVYLIKGKTRKCIVKPWMIIVPLTIWGVYLILRCVLLIWGIDIIGDIFPPIYSF